MAVALVQFAHVPVLQRLAVATFKDDAVILQKHLLLGNAQIHDPVFRVRDHDLSHAGVARTIHHTVNLLRGDVPRRKHGVIRLDQRKDTEQLRQQIATAVRHADATRFSALAVFILRVYGWQPDDLRAHAQSSLHRLLVESAGLPVQDQSAVHIKRIVAVDSPIICVAQRRACDGAAVMPLDDDRSCTRTDGCVRQLQIVTGPADDVRCSMDVQIYDAIQNIFLLCVHESSLLRKKKACRLRKPQAAG